LLNSGSDFPRRNFCSMMSHAANKFAEVTMSDQVQCPNCGGYKVSGSAIIEKVFPEEREVRPLGTSYIIFFWVLFLTFVILTLGIGLLFLFSSQIRKPLGGKQELVKTSRVAGYHYTCQLCGYQWTRRVGTPQPEVHVRSDLIAKGEQRLKEERRRREEAEEAAAAAAAAWWLQQRQKKR